MWVKNVRQIYCFPESVIYNRFSQAFGDRSFFHAGRTYNISGVILKLLLNLNTRNVHEDVLFIKLLLIGFMGSERVAGIPDDETKCFFKCKCILILWTEKNYPRIHCCIFSTYRFFQDQSQERSFPLRNVWRSPGKRDSRHSRRTLCLMDPFELKTIFQSVFKMY